MNMFFRRLRRPPLKDIAGAEAEAQLQGIWAFWPEKQQVRIHFVRGGTYFGTVRA